MWSKANQSQLKNSYEHQWNLDFGESEKGRVVKIRTSKNQLFLQDSALSLFKCRLFPKSTFKECGGPGREERELTIESLLVNAVCTQRILEHF